MRRLRFHPEAVAPKVAVGKKAEVGRNGIGEKWGRSIQDLVFFDPKMGF